MRRTARKYSLSARCFDLTQTMVRQHDLLPSTARQCDSVVRFCDLAQLTARH